MDYLIVLFKNKEKKKIINKFKTEKRAINFFNSKIKESDSVIFDRETENGHPCSFELAVLRRKTKNNQPLYIKDDFGRQVKVELQDDDYEIFKVQRFHIEESFLDCTKNKKITSHDFIKKYINKSGVKMISKLNNKIVVQNDINFHLFTFKSVNDADRFVDSLTTKFNSDGRKDCIFVKDYSTIHRKYLYKMLVDQGFSISYLQRYSTTFPSKK